MSRRNDWNYWSDLCRVAFSVHNKKVIISRLYDGNQLVSYILGNIAIWGLASLFIELVTSSGFSSSSSQFNWFDWLVSTTVYFTIWDLIPLLVYTRLMSDKWIGIVVGGLLIVCTCMVATYNIERAIPQFFGLAVLLSLCFYTHLSYRENK